MDGKKLTSIAISGLLVSSFIFSAGAGAVFAEGDSTGADQIEMVDEGTTTDTGAEVTTVETGTEEVSAEPGTVTDETAASEEQAGQDETVTDEDQAKQDENAAEKESVQEKAPSLVPGDFFYFVKIMTEKIRLAATFDNYKEAKLLADFAAERIAESNALLAEGKTEEAAELLKEAIATQEQANDELADSEDAVEDQGTNADGTAEAKLLNNVNGLVNALSHVKNENAQKRIMKNLEKSFTKLDKKLTKLEEKDAKLAEKKKRIEEKVAGKRSDDEAAAVKGHKGKALGKQKVKKAEAAKIEESSTTSEQATTVEDEAAATTTEVTQTEAAVKPNSASEKGAEKQVQAAVRAAEKQAKAEQKKVQAQEKQNKPANNGQGNKGEKGNGKGNN